MRDTYNISLVVEDKEFKVIMTNDIELGASFSSTCKPDDFDFYSDILILGIIESGNMSEDHQGVDDTPNWSYSVDSKEEY